MQKQTYKHIDLFKFICAILVIGIHSQPFLGINDTAGYWFEVLARIGVPFFFMASAFFLFRDISEIKLKKFLIRLLKLYLFWFIISFPHVVVIRFILPEHDFITNLIVFIKGILFGSSFRGSWYLNALMLSSILVYFLQKKTSFLFTFIIGAFLYIISCISSSYMCFFSSESIIVRFVESYKYTFAISPFNSLPAGVIFVSLGAFIATRRDLFILKKSNLILSLIVCIMLVFVENYLLDGYIRATDSFFTLVPLSFVIFLCCLKLDSSNKHMPSDTVFFRNSSTIMYFAQFILIDIYSFLIKTFIGISYKNMIVFILVVITTILLTVIIQKLEKHKLFSILKYSY